MSSTTHLKNIAIRHAIYLQRFSGGQSNELQLAVISARKIAKRNMGKRQIINLPKNKQVRIVERIGKAVRAEYVEATTKTFNTMEDLAVQEVGFNERALDSAVNVTVKPARAALTDKLVFDTPIAFGLDKKAVTNQVFKDFSKKKTRQIQQVIRDGILSGHSNGKMRRQLDVVSKFQRRQADALVRTTVNHVSNQTRNAVGQANKDIVKGWIYTATLDSATTDICAGLDGRELPLDTAIVPPMHINCRSTNVPNVKKEFSQFPNEKVSRVARGPSGKTERVDGRTTYNSWLREQPKSFQEDVLGKTRAKLYRDGDLPINKFTDEKFRTITLDELAKTEPAAFERAGLS